VKSGYYFVVAINSSFGDHCLHMMFGVVMCAVIAARTTANLRWN
jgi:heme/copper-type cytochrome/quinol oxidase subunit 3